MLLKVISFLLSLVNGFVVIYSVSQCFDSFLNVLLLILLILTFLVPPLVYSVRRSCVNWTHYYPSMFIYVVCMPLYLIVFQIYSYANLHDVSWGNRDASADKSIKDSQKKLEEIKKERDRRKEYKKTRLLVFLAWLVMNLIVGYTMTYLSRNGMSGLLKAISYIFAIFQILKIVGMFGYKAKIRGVIKRMKDG